MMPIKACRECKVTKPLSEYHRHQSSPGGLRAVCKACLRIRRPPIGRGTLEQRLARFVANVIFDSSGCWIWKGLVGNEGYAAFFAGRYHAGHRWLYEVTTSPVPRGLQLDHLCRLRRCVNPDHLEPVTPRENVLRSNGLAAINARKTHCKRGHPFDKTNTEVRLHGKGRSCRRCVRLVRAGKRANG